jgi:enoyl-CoA hydratase/carnithine racemase
VSAPLICVEERDGFATVTLNNPPVNALSNDVLQELRVAVEALRARRDVRAVILTGQGSKAFAAGADLEEFSRMLNAAPEAIAHHTTLSRGALSAISEMPQPTIAAVQASAVGGGLELALVCDFVVSARSARFGLPEVGVGLIPGAGGTQRLPRVVGLRIATEMVLFGRLLTAEEALDAGLVSRVVDADRLQATAEEWATELAKKPALAVQAAKTALRAAETGVALEEGLAQESSLFLAVCRTQDAREGVEAFLARRPPRFLHT